MPDTPPRVAIYARVSLAEQAKHGYSIPHQLDACRALIAAGGQGLAPGGTLAGVWQDVETGTRAERDGYQALLTAHAAWDVLLVWKSDRLGRDEAELFRVVKELRRRGKRLVSATENVDDPFVLGLLFLLAARESRLIGERVRPINQRLTREGRHVSRPPLGYRMVDKRLVVDVAEAALYHELVDRLEAGDSIRGICLAWNARGSRSRQGKLWQPSHLAKVARNPLHAGLVRRAGVDGLVPGQHTPLIDHARWQRLQCRLDETRRAISLLRPAAGRPAPAWLLTGFFRCGCGSAIVHYRRTYGAAATDYYICNRHRLTGGCPIGRVVRCAVADAAVDTWLAPLTRRATPTDLAAAALAAVTRQQTAADREQARERARLESAVRVARQRVAALVDALVDGHIDQTEYHAHRARYLAEAAAAETALAALPPSPAALAPADAQRHADLIWPLGREWQAASLARRRDLLRGLGVQVTRTATHLTVTGRADLAPYLPPLIVAL